jgi:23S rRNA pseudouridine2604 synthase
MEGLKRINKFISDSGFCSRREADKLVEAGRVCINGKKAEVGSKIKPGDKVSVDNKPIESEKKRIYLAFNKPIKITSTTNTKEKDNIIDFIGYTERIFPIGRLDKMSEGLIFLTNDGDIVNKILRAGNKHEKEYIVNVNKEITDDFIKRMGSGVKILGGTTLPCRIKRDGKRSFKIILTQGLNRQIRRMCETLGFKVMKLKRIRIMNIELEDIKTGKWRYLTEEEINKINKLTEKSSKTI